MLLDSNIVIYSVQPVHKALRAFIAANSPAVSAITYVEVLGYHRLTSVDRHTIEQFFMAAITLHIDRPVLDQAVRLRQLRRISLGDAIIAATALVHNRALVTHNVSDFQWIPGLRLLDPITAGPLQP
jgi:hypothetical protein